MQKKLLFNMVLLVLVNLLVKPYWILGIDRHFQNLVGVEQYGIYVKLLGISMILTMLLDFGINNYNSTKIAVNPGILRDQFAALATLKLILSSVYLTLTITVAYLYGVRGDLLLFIILLSLNAVIAHFSTFVRSCISGIQLFKTDALLSATDRFIMILLGICLLSGWLFKISIFYFIFIQTIGYLGVLLAGYLVLAPRVQPIKLRFDMDLMRSLFMRTLPYALLAFIMLLYTQADRLLMPKLLTDGDIQNGIYASGGRLLDAANMMIGATAVIMMPFFAKMISNGENLTPISKQLTGWMLVPVIFFATFSSAYGSEIMQILTPQSTPYMAHVFQVLILCFIPYGFMYTYGSMLTAKAEMRILNIVCGLALAVNLILNFIFIPRWGALGAAYAALVTQIIVGGGKFIFAVFKMDLKHPVIHYFKLFGYLIISLFGARILQQNEIQFILGAAIMGTFTISWLLIMQMIDIRSLSVLIRQKINAFKA